LFFFVALFVAYPVHAQVQFTLFDSDASRYPEIGVLFEARDANDRFISDYLPSDFTVVENGIQRPVLSVLCPPPMTPQVSITLTIDLSFSMTIANRLNNVKVASSQLVQDLSYPPAMTGITTFADNPFIELEYTSDKQRILNTIDGLRASGGGTDFATAFLHPTSGALAFTENRPGERYIIFMTDAFETMSAAIEQQIIIAARNANIRIFTVTVSPNTVNLTFRRIAVQTGGAWFENVVSEEDAKRIFRQIGEQIFLYPPCELIYLTDGCDTERYLQVTLRKLGRTVTRNTMVSVPASKIVTLAVSSPLLDYGVVSAGSTRDMNVLITARNGPMTIRSITSPESAFRIMDYGGSAPPFALSTGQSRTIRIQYRPVTTERVNGRLVFDSDAPCEEAVTMSGGLSDPAPLKLITPNGGETLFSGSMYQARWSGVSSTTPIELEYSTNSGEDWVRITDNVYNYSYNWRVPNTPSNTCLGMVFSKEERITQLDGIWTGQQPAVINALAVAHSGVLAALGLANGQIKLFYPRDAAFVTILPGHAGGIAALAFSPDIRTLASAGSDGTVKIWDMRSGTLTRTLTGLTGTLHSVAFSHDGSLLAAANTGTIILWQTSNWAERWRHNGDTGADAAIAIAPDNTWLASAAGNRIAILNTSDGSLIRNLTGHTGAVRSLDISQDGYMIASGSEDRNIRLWNTLTWNSIHTLTGHGGAVRSVSLTNSGVRVLSASRDNSVRIWDGLKGTLLHTLSGHTNDVLSAVVDHRIKYILSGGLDRSLRIWGYVPPLADTSDSLWTIVTTVTSLDHDPPRFDVLECPDTWSDSDVLLHNIGNQVVTISGLTITGPDAEAFSVRDGFSIPPSVQLRPEDTLRIPLRFFPTVADDYSAELLLDTDISGMPQYAIPLFGHKDSVSLVVSADTLFCGEMYHCSDAAMLPLLLTNGGTVTIVVDSLSSSDADVFSFAATLSRTILPGETDTIYIRVAPNTDGVIDGTLRLGVTPCDYEFDVVIRGTRMTPTPVAEPNPVYFAFTEVNETSYATLTLTNPSETEMLIDSTATLFTSPPFSIVSGPEFPIMLQPDASVQIQLSFTPQSEGEATGQLYFHAALPCEDSIFVDLIGSSLRKPFIYATHTTFDDLICDEDTVSFATVTLRNTGGQELEVDAIRLDGEHPDEFRIISPAPPFTLLPGAVRDVHLAFAPQVARIQRRMEFIVESNAANKPELVLSFNGFKHEVSWEITGGNIDFGEVYDCNLPLTDVVSYTNTGTHTLTLRVDTDLLNPEFYIPDLYRSYIVPPGETLNLSVILHPTSYASRTEVLRMSAEPCLDAFEVEYRYSFTSHSASVSPAIIDFGTSNVSTPVERLITITNPLQRNMQIDLTELELEGITVLPPVPSELSPGQSESIRLRAMSDVPMQLGGMIKITTTVAGCVDSAFVTLHGLVEESTATISLTDATAAVGDHVSIPISLRNSSNLQLAGTKSFRIELLFNRSMLWPESVSSATGDASMTTVAEGALLRVIINVQQTDSPPDGILAELHCLVLLGNDDVTDIAIDDFAWLEGGTQTLTIPGHFTATGICEEGGKRLLSMPGVPVLLRNAPNPFVHRTELTFQLTEHAAIDLRIYSSLGREVATAASGEYSAGVHSVSFDAADLPSGVYIAVLRTHSGISTMTMLRAR